MSPPVCFIEGLARLSLLSGPYLPEPYLLGGGPLYVRLTILDRGILENRWDISGNGFFVFQDPLPLPSANHWLPAQLIM